MAQIPLTKVRIVTLRSDMPAVLEHLQKAGYAEVVTEIKNAEEVALQRTEQSDFSYATLAARLETAIAFLSPYVKDPDALRAVFEGNRTHTTLSKIDALARSVDPTNILNTVDRIHTRLVEVATQEAELASQEATIRAWERINLPLQEIADSAHTSVFPVHAGERDLDALVEKLSTHEFVHTERISESALLLVAHRDSREAVEMALRDASLTVLRLPHTQGLPKDELERIASLRATLRDEKILRETEARTLAEQELATLKQLADHSIWAAKRTKKLYQLYHTEGVSLCDAWVPRASQTALTEDLERTFGSVAVEAIEPSEGEVPPTAILNRGAFYPFEFITRLYGVPGHRDLDPTPFLSFFFALFFGACLSDVGYGATLAALTGFVLFRYKIQGGMRQLMWALNIGGLSAIVMGVLYGGYFGLSAAAVHPALVTLQKFDPIADPMPVFFLALTFGVLHVMYGIILDIQRAASQGAFVSGLLDNVPWLVMFFIIIAYVLAFGGVLPEPLKSVVLTHWGTAAILAAVSISLTKARLGTNIGDKLVKGVLALYGGVNYFSDILSYSRLLALGLATSALGYSINLIAGIIAGPELGIGTVFAIIILIFGHTLNLVLSTLGAFINSARLQFVEFFSKFLGGTGRPFDPFAREAKHTLLLPEKPG